MAKDALKLAYLLAAGVKVDSQRDISSYRNYLCNYLGVKYAWPLGGARMGIYLILKSLEPTGRTEVIIPGYTCVVVPNAVRWAGFKPVYADIRLTDLNVDPASIERKITSSTRAIIVQHTYGIPAELDVIREICRSHNLLLIEDAAHALGAIYDNRRIGTWGDAAVFSSVSNKMISTDKGGFLVTSDPELAAKINHVYNHLECKPDVITRLACMRIIDDVLAYQPLVRQRVARLMRTRIRRLASATAERASLDYPGYDSSEYNAELAGHMYEGYPRRMPGILCKVGLWQLKRLDADIDRRVEKAKAIVPMLAKYGAAPFQSDTVRSRPSLLNLPIMVNNRVDWQQALARVGFQTRGYLRDPLHPPETTCHKANNYQRGCCPNAEYASEHVLNVPLGPSTTMTSIGHLKALSV